MLLEMQQWAEIQRLLFRGALGMNFSEIFKKYITTKKYSLKKVWEISKNHRKTPVMEYLLISSNTIVFLMSFAEFLRTPFLQNTSGGCFCLLKLEIGCENLLSLRFTKFTIHYLTGYY